MSLATLPQTDWAAAMFRAVARHLIPPNGLYDVQNGLTDDDGSIYKRGGSEYLSNAAFGATGLRWLWDGYLVPGRRTVFAKSDDFGVLDADDATPVNLGGAGLSAPVKPAVMKGLMFIPGGELYAGSRKTANYTTGTVSVTAGSTTVTGAGTTWNTLTDAGMLFRIGARYYVVQSIDSTTQLTLTEAYAGSTAAGQAYTLAPIGSASTAGYRVADIYAAAGGRMLACVDDKVYFSAWNNPHSWTATDYHQLPRGVKCLGAVGLRDTALIFTTGGLFVISNLQFDLTSDFGDPQHRLDHVNEDLVLWGAAGMAAFADAQIVPAIDGVWLIPQGDAPVALSRSIQPLYADHVKNGNKPGGGATYRNHYFLPILDSSNNVVDLLVCRLDRPIETGAGVIYPWTRFDGHGGNVTALAVRVPAGTGRPKLLAACRAAASRVLDVSGYFEPAAANAIEADGTVHEFDVTTRDYPTGDLNENLLRRARARYELVAAGNTPTIQAYVSIGAIEGDVSLWGAMLWGETWSSSEDAEFTLLEGNAPADDGRNPFVWRPQRRARYVRLRFRSSDAAAKLVLRSLELFIRPSAKV